MRQRILVTGSHRSGSTWVGEIISSSPKVRYIHEPFNIGIKVYKHPFKYWFQHLVPNDVNNESLLAKKYIESFDQANRLNFYLSMFRVGAPKNGHLAEDFKSSINSSFSLVKDPIALLSAEWFYEIFRSKIIITIRHPAAFIASLKVKNWQFDFNNLLAQESFICEYLPLFKDEILKYSNESFDIIDQGILLWNLLHSVILNYKAKFEKEWYFIKHETLSLDPATEFRKVCEYIGLEYNERINKKVIDTSTSKGKTNISRDSKSNIRNWKKRLSPDEINKIKVKTSYIASSLGYHSENDW